METRLPGSLMGKRHSWLWKRQASQGVVVAGLLPGSPEQAGNGHPQGLASRRSGIRQQAAGRCHLANQNLLGTRTPVQAHPLHLCPEVHFPLPGPPAECHPPAPSASTEQDRPQCLRQRSDVAGRVGGGTEEGGRWGTLTCDPGHVLSQPRRQEEASEQAYPALGSAWGLGLGPSVRVRKEGQA